MKLSANWSWSWQKLELEWAWQATVEFTSRGGGIDHF